MFCQQQVKCINQVSKVQRVICGRGTEKSYISVSNSIIQQTIIQSNHFICSDRTSAGKIVLIVLSRRCVLYLYLSCFPTWDEKSRQDRKFFLDKNIVNTRSERIKHTKTVRNSVLCQLSVSYVKYSCHIFLTCHLKYFLSTSPTCNIKYT